MYRTFSRYQQTQTKYGGITEPLTKTLSKNLTKKLHLPRRRKKDFKTFLAHRIFAFYSHYLKMKSDLAALKKNLKEHWTIENIQKEFLLLCFYHKSW